MEEMISAIRAAVAEEATPEAKTGGVHACRTIAAALEAQVGKPILLPGVPATNPLAGLLSPQTLDLLIGHFRNLANERDRQRNATTEHGPAGGIPEAVERAPETGPAPQPGLRFPLVQAPRAVSRQSRPPNSGRPIARRR